MYEEKNRKIRENGKATRERRSHMDCRVISVKVQENRLSKAKLEKLYRCFLEGKWYEQGKMGWFGMSDTTSDSLKEYTKFFNKTLEELKQTHPHATVTLVDCHI